MVAGFGVRSLRFGGKGLEFGSEGGGGENLESRASPPTRSDFPRNPKTRERCERGWLGGQGVAGEGGH